MSRHFADWDERTLELAVDRVTVGLDDAERVTLHESADAAALEDFEYALASLHLGALGRLEEPPAQLMQTIREDARLHLPAAADVASGPKPAVAPRSLAWAAVAGWLAAAILVAAFLLQGALEKGPLDARGRRHLLVASSPDVQRIAWSSTADELAREVAGDVTWSAARQEGYMRLRGLRRNDPAQNQYQLWIFDKSRADWEAKPVDGGVFDVDGDDVVVPIDPKLEVREAALFAITLEDPGGVVVSARERLLLTAAAPE